MDIRMPGLDGLAATKEICCDESLRAAHVLILTTFELDEYVARALRAGASRFLGKDVGPAELLRAIRTIAAGETLLSPQRPGRSSLAFLAHPERHSTAARALDVLTACEREVLVQVAEGLSNEEIAERMYLSPLTVRTHVQHAMTKLDARHRAQLVVIAYRSPNSWSSPIDQAWCVSNHPDKPSAARNEHVVPRDLPQMVVAGEGERHLLVPEQTHVRPPNRPLAPAEISPAEDARHVILHARRRVFRLRRRAATGRYMRPRARRARLRWWRIRCRAPNPGHR